MQSQSQYDRHLRSERQRIARIRANETVEQRSQRQQRDREWHQQARMEEAAVQRPTRRARSVKMAGFCYDVTTYTDFDRNYGNIGGMNIVCTYCQALRFKEEPAGMCCKHGRVEQDPFVPKIPKPPDQLMPLFSLQTSQSKQFIGNSRKYNSAFQMSSILTQWEVLPGFMPTVKISGHLYHRIGSLVPSLGEDPKFLQIYFIGKYQKQI